MKINIVKSNPDDLMRKITYYTIIGILSILFIFVLPVFLLGYIVSKVLEVLGVI